MSKGVAVVFKRYFGKPTPADFINQHLARQIIRDRSTIYSLVTKSKYYKKPSKLDYEKAFQALTEDFRKNNLTQLICSPLGCVRDKVSPDCFVTNLKRFQETTGANVIIAVTENRTPTTRSNSSSLATTLHDLLKLLDTTQMTSTKPADSDSSPRSSSNDDSHSKQRNAGHDQPDVQQSSHYSSSVSVSSEVSEQSVSPGEIVNAPPIITPGPLSFSEMVKGFNSNLSTSSEANYVKGTNDSNFLEISLAELTEN